MSEPQLIETIPQHEKVLVFLPETGLWWPGYAYGEKVYSNAHGRLNDPENEWSYKATHWMPMPANPAE